MKCECGKWSSTLIENEDGTVTPVCWDCYYGVIKNKPDKPKKEKGGTK